MSNENLREFVATNVIEQIKQFNTLRLNPKTHKFYVWLLSKGESFEGRKLSKKEEEELERLLTSPLYRYRRCYYNGQMIAVSNAKFGYYEGYAQTTVFGLNMEHAWLVNDGTVFDPTWKDGAEYFGVKVPTPFIRKNISKTSEAQSVLIPYVYSQLEKEEERRQ